MDLEVIIGAEFGGDFGAPADGTLLEPLSDVNWLRVLLGIWNHLTIGWLGFDGFSYVSFGYSTSGFSKL